MLQREKTKSKHFNIFNTFYICLLYLPGLVFRHAITAQRQIRINKKEKGKTRQGGVMFAYAFWTFLKSGGCVFRMQFGQ